MMKHALTRLAARCALALPGMCAMASETVSDVAIATAANGAELVVSTRSQTVYPTDIGQPSFWLDCSDRIGWTLDGDVAVRIPCKVLGGAVNPRYLTTNRTDGVFSWQPTGATVGNDGSLNYAFLDFGAVGSKRGLLFDAVLDEGAAQATNRLADIGTVVAVYNSERGGGCLLGGGYTAPGNRSVDGYLWTRGTYDGLGAVLATCVAPALSNGNCADRFVFGSILHDGVDSTPYQVGFSGGWEIIATESRDQNPSSSRLNGGLPDASGIGLNDGRGNQGRLQGGGMKIAEMLIYDRCLSRDELARLDAYLRAKWFPAGRTDGWNGDARIGSLRLSSRSSFTSATVATVDVPSGETLRVDRVHGGRAPYEDANKPALVKTGTGTLVVDGASAYNGTIELRGGTLAFERLPAPSLDDLPTNMVARFDASDVSSFTSTAIDGVEYIGEMRNLATGPDSLYQERHAITLVPPSDGQRPFLRANALGEGLNVVDFGPKAANVANTGRHFQFTANGGAVTLPFTTAIAAFGLHNYSGSLLDNTFRRPNNGGGALGSESMVSPVVSHGYSASTTVMSYTNGVVWLDGRRFGSDGFFDHPGYHVYAHQSMVANAIGASRVGSPDNAKYAGGIRLMELILYRRPLAKREIEDVQAYLSAKWFKRATPGYARSENDAGDDLQKVRVAASAAIDVPAGATVTIGELVIEENARLSKTGGGTLKVRAGANLADSIDIACGTVEFEGRRAVASVSEAAAVPSMHLDASDSSRIDIYEAGGTNFVMNWHSADFGNFCFVPSFWKYVSTSPCNVRNPWISPDVTLNGRHVVDFGDYGVTAAPYSPTMTFASPLDSVRSVYAVIKFKGGKGQLLGSSQAMGGDAEYYDFSRDGDGGEGKRLLWSTSGSRMSGDRAEIRTNGVAAAYTLVPCGDFQLVEIHTSGGAHASALACGVFKDNSGTHPRHGGVMLAEVLLYERELSAREKVATRNYLMSKWFNAEAQALPDEDPQTAIVWRISRDCGTDDVKTVQGPASLVSNAVINLENFPADGFGRQWQVLKAGSLTIPDDVTVLIDGAEVPKTLRVKLAFVDGTLSVRFAPKGIMLILR